MDTNIGKRTIGFHPCIGKKASGEERPTTVVIRTADGKHAAYEFGEQQLLDFFTCGAALGWRDAVTEDLHAQRPPHHVRWAESDEKAWDAFQPSDPAKLEEERSALFRVTRHKKTGEISGYFRAQAPTALVVLDPAADTVGVANGGLGYQIMEVLLGRYPGMDMRVIGSGTLKERRPEFDRLLPASLRKKAEKARLASEDESPASGVTGSGDAGADSAHPDQGEEDEETEEVSKSAAKDANAKFDAHRIAYALADEEAARPFRRCTLRDRDWAGANIAYGLLETARKARVAAEQQFRQAHRTELRKLVKNPRVPFVTLAAPGTEETQTIESLLGSYETALRISVAAEKAVTQKLEVLRQAYARIEGARAHEEEMEKNLEHALRALPEYTEFLARAKEAVHEESGLPLGKYIGERIFGRWIAGFGSPMSSRLDEPMRQADAERIAGCRETLTAAIARLDCAGLPEQPEPGNGKTREWLLACERIASERAETSSGAEAQLAQVAACRDAYRALTSAKKCAANRPLNRVIAFMGLHVKQGGKYADVKPELSFPRRRKGGRANWNEQLLRQGAYQWATLIVKGTKNCPPSYWKAHVYLPYKERLMAGGMKRGHAHKRAGWRMITLAVRWLISEWFKWERNRALTETSLVRAAAA